jgi:hypothetical protein
MNGWSPSTAEPGVGSMQDGTATVSESRAFVAEMARLALGLDAAEEPSGT